jgi:hypothetical protein
MFIRAAARGAFVLLLFSQLAFAQDANRVKVDVVYAGEDRVGENVAAAVRAQLLRSPEFVIGDSADHIVRINIVGLDAASAGSAEGLRSAISVVYTMANYLPLEEGNPQTWYPIFLTSAIRLVGRDRTEAVARDIVSTLENEMREYRTAARRR